jgi:gluconokinase
MMGVAGSGKSTVGLALAEALGWLFIEGDDYHSKSNADKIASGTPLGDEDRWPWLQELREVIEGNLESDRSVVVSCSALKQSYRNLLQGGTSNIHFVYLKGDYDLIYRRMQTRPHPYMHPEMLRSQFETLEEPLKAFVVEVSDSVDVIVSQILSRIH